MKQQVSPPVLIAIIVGVVLLLSVIGWQVFGSHDNAGSPAQKEALIAANKAKKDKE